MPDSPERVKEAQHAAILLGQPPPHRIMVRFQLQANDSGARAGLLFTSHGVVETPAFMPVGTQGSVKALGPDDLHAIGAQIILANAYHLSLRPGVEAVKRGGGLHRFMGWNRPLLSDSGGFQLFSLSHLQRLTDDGVHFRSHIDGSEHFLSPELAVQYQEGLGVDIAMALDHCPAYGDSPTSIEAAMQRTHHWAERSLKAHHRKDQALFGIVQGGWSPELRRQSAGFLSSLDFDGFAVGGVSVGEPKELAYQTVAQTVPHLSQAKPRYLMGVGSPEDLVRCVAMGIDLFDCALPTRLARNGSLFTSSGRAPIRAARFRGMEGPVDNECDCYACTKLSAAYLHHLFHAGELLYYRLATLHNLRFILTLMERMRNAIVEQRFQKFAETFLAGYKPTNEEVRLAQKSRWLEARAHQRDAPRV